MALLRREWRERRLAAALGVLALLFGASGLATGVVRGAVVSGEARVVAAIGVADVVLAPAVSRTSGHQPVAHRATHNPPAVATAAIVLLLAAIAVARRRSRPTFRSAGRAPVGIRAPPSPGSLVLSVR